MAERVPPAPNRLAASSVYTVIMRIPDPAADVVARSLHQRRRVRVALGVSLAMALWAGVAPPTSVNASQDAQAPRASTERRAIPTDNTKLSTLDRAVHEAVTTFFEDPVHVGLSLVVSHNGQVAFYNYGTVSTVSPRLPTPNTLYEIGSITKTFTGVLAVRALNDGRMDLDGDFRRHLPGPYPNLELGGRPITLRTLITHTSGMPRDIPANDHLFKNPDFETLPHQLIALEGPYDRSRYLRELHLVSLATAPGEKQHYSNIGIKLIGFGLEKVFRRTFVELVEDFITRPHQMPSTTLEVAAADRGRVAQGYSPGGNASPYHLPNAGAAGGLYSSTRDMARYLEWHLNEADPLIGRSHAVVFGDLPSFAQGMGWNMANTAELGRKVWQSGGVFGMSSQMVLFPEDGIGLVLLANDAGFNTQGQLDVAALSVVAAMRKVAG
jgi:CubicO group peptidase (beta-lactamase class C family)